MPLPQLVVTKRICSSRCGASLAVLRHSLVGFNEKRPLARDNYVSQSSEAWFVSATSFAIGRAASRCCHERDLALSHACNLPVRPRPPSLVVSLGLPSSSFASSRAHFCPTPFRSSSMSRSLRLRCESPPLPFRLPSRLATRARSTWVVS
eukprot:2822917-Pleurochrysis_carterae.AAC.2